MISWARSTIQWVRSQFDGLDDFLSRIPSMSGDLQMPPLPEKMASDGNLQMARSGGSGGEARREPVCCGAVTQRLRWLVNVNDGRREMVFWAGRSGDESMRE